MVKIILIHLKNGVQAISIEAIFGDHDTEKPDADEFSDIITEEFIYINPGKQNREKDASK